MASTRALLLVCEFRMKKPRKKRRRKRPAADLEATYICDSCGEEIVVPVDISAGSRQDYVEDCPVCCHPMTLHIAIDPDGEAHVEGEHE
jgi:transcription elongation factor Elf1